MVFKFSEDYSQIIFILKIGLIKDVDYCFKSQNNFMIMKTKSSYQIYETENFKL